MIALNEQSAVTSACRSWCSSHVELTETGSLMHCSEPIFFTWVDGQEVSVHLDALEASDGIGTTRICLTQDGADDSIELADARTLADALNELITAEESR